VPLSTSWLPSLLSQNQRLLYRNILIKHDNVHEEEYLRRSSTLDGHEDWEAWNHELMSRAVATNLGECIDPDYDEDFLEKPEKLGISQLRKKANPPQTQSTQASSYTAMPAPELVTNKQARYGEDLTIEARQQYSLIWSIFQHDSKQYDIQRAAFNELKSWTLKIASENYISMSCPPQLPPQDDLRIEEEPHTIEDGKNLGQMDHSVGEDHK
jgi:hypothetical protein